MKKLFLLLALLGIVATGCSKDEEGNIPDDAYISLNKEIVNISPDGESVDVKVYSNYAWELTNNCDWITTSITSGDASDTGVTVTLTADLTYDDREGTIIFSCGKAKKLLVVSQKLKEVIIPDANDTFNIPVEGGVAVISYQTSVDCEVIIPEEAQDWITIAPATRGLVSENINLDIAENTTYSARTAVIKVVAKDNAELAVEYTINQEQNDTVLANGNTEFTIDGRGQQITIEHKANVDCEVIIPDEAQDWVTIAPATRGLSIYSTTLNIAENNSDEERSCVVKVVSQDDNELFAEYTIVQNPRYYLYYTSNDGEIVTPYNSSAFGATILSNTYIDGVGVIEFNAPITTIGERAFYECYSLTSVTIPDSVTAIGDDAFYGCTGELIIYSKIIETDYTDNNSPSYYGWLKGVKFTKLTIGDSVTTIGDYAFFWCESLTSVTIPDSVTTIGEYAFSGCSSLTSVTIGDSVTTIGSSAFSGCSSLTSVTIPDRVTTIGTWAFCYCIDLTSVTIPDSVTTIGDGAFMDCYSLTSVTIGDSITTIGERAFSGCSSLQEFKGKFASEDGRCLIIDGTLNSFAPAGLTGYTIPDSVTTIGDDAFYGCSSLTSVTIGDSVTTIGNDAFYGCSSLTSVTIPNSVTMIGDNAFWGCNSLQEFNGKFASEDGRCLIIDGTLNSFAPAGLTGYTIPDSVTAIGYAAFANCSGLSSVTIPDSVTAIGYAAFAGCSGLSSVTIGDSVTTIGTSAFVECSSLTSITIPDSVTTIGEYAFAYCSSLTSVYCKAVTPPTGNYYMFSNNASGCTIYVPTESVEAYKSATYWRDYADAIVGYEF